MQPSENEASHATSPPPSNLERTRLWLNFAKFLLGTVALGAATAYINADLKDKEIHIKEIDLENSHLVRVLEPGIADDLGKRLALAKYFSILSRTDEAKGRWKNFASYVLSELLLTENDIEINKARIRQIRNEITGIESQTGGTSEDQKQQIDQLQWNLIRLQREVRDLEIAARGKSGVILGTLSSPDKSNEVLEEYVGWDGTQYTNQANVQELRAWMEDRGLTQSLVSLLNSYEFEGVREKAIADLNIDRTVQSTITNVPTEAVKDIVDAFRFSGATEVTRTQHEDGNWTITARFQR